MKALERQNTTIAERMRAQPCQVKIQLSDRIDSRSPRISEEIYLQVNRSTLIERHKTRASSGHPCRGQVVIRSVDVFHHLASVVSGFP